MLHLNNTTYKYIILETILHNWNEEIQTFAQTISLFKSEISYNSETNSSLLNILTKCQIQGRIKETQGSCRLPFCLHSC